MSDISRNRLLIIVGAVVVALVATLVTVWALPRDDSNQGQTAPLSTALSTSASEPPPSSSPPVSSQVRPSDDLAGEQADGCLGGADPYAAVLAAQQQATPDEAGAAAFARAVMRWTVAYPVDPNADKVAAAIGEPNSPFLGTAAQSMRKVGQDFADGGVVSVRTSAGMGQYRVKASFYKQFTPPEGDATVQLTVFLDEKKATGDSVQVKITTELILSFKGGRWWVFGRTPPELQRDPATGSGWVPFAGACS